MKSILSWLQTSFAGVAVLAVSALFAGSPMEVHAAAFTTGDIVVYRVGSGTGTEGSTGNPVFVDEYTTSGALVQSIALPTTSSGTGSSPNALIASGTATSEGMLTRSTDGRYLVLTGYKATIPTTGLASTTSASVPRVIGRVDASGNIDTTTALTDWTSGSNPRSACSVDGTAFWGAGNSGDNYATFGSTTSTALNSKNSKVISIFNGQLYISSSSGGTLIATLGTGLPTTTGQTVANIPGTFTTTSPYGYVFVTLNGGASPDTLYVADDTVSSGVIQKYALVGGSWTLKGSITATAVRGLTATVSGTTVTLYATTGGGTATGGGSIYTVADTAGYNVAPSTTTVATIATAAANTAFRGIAFAPVSYTLTYNGNGNTGGSAPIDGSSPYASGATVTVLGAGSLTQTDNTFVGWNTAADGSGTSYVPSATFTIVANTTLYAQWTPSVTYTVTYDGNGNTGGTVPIDPNSPYLSGATVTVLGNTGGLTQTGYVFAGWNTAPDGSGTSYAATGSATFTMGSANVILYAQWTQNPSITILGGPLNFGSVAEPGGTSVLTYTVSGANLMADITITAPANFEVSTDNVSYSSGLSLTPSLGTVASTTIYVQFGPTAQQGYSGSIANTSSGATEQDVAVTGTGAAIPSVTTQAANLINTTGATLNGTVTANNGAAITDRGFYWNTSGNVGTSDNQVDEGGFSTGTFSKAIASGTLSPNKIYYYRAYAVNSIGQALDSSDTSFYTLANTPTAPSIGNPAATSLDVAIGSGDGNPSTTIYAIQQKSSSQYVQADGTLGASAAYQTASAWGTVRVTGLSQGTFYTFQVKAQNQAGIDTAFGPTVGASTSALAFTPADLVVERVGNGTETLSSSGNTIFLDEFTMGGAAVQSIEIPNNGSSALIESGTAGSDGGITRSSDGQVLCFPGYNTNQPYSSSIVNAPGTAVPRGVGLVSSNGNYTLAVTSTTANSGNNIRGAATDNAGNYWCSGGSSGINYLGSGPPASVYSTVANLRCLNIFGPNLWYDTTSGATTRGIWEFTGTPTSSATPSQVITLGANDSPYNFSVDNPASPTTIYYADDGTQGNGSGAGIHKWTNGVGGWAQAYVVYSSSGVYGLAVNWATTPPTIYATTTNSANSLIKITDNGAGSAATVLDTAPAGEFYRGIAFTPKGSQTIGPIAATATKTYGDGSYSVATTASSGLTVTYSSDNTLVATVDSSGQVTIVGAGTADILVDQAGNDFYYSAVQLSQTLTVNPLPVVLTGSRDYDGTANASASILTVVNNLDGANLTLSGGVSLADSSAGPESISDFTGLTLGGSAAGNYTLVDASGTVTVGQVALTITAEPQTITYGTSVPATAVTYGGFVNGETNTVLTIQPTVASAQSGVAAAGVYFGNYTPSGAVDPNYLISYASGTLTVGQLAAILTGARPYDGTAIATSSILSVANAVGGDDVSAASGSATLASASVGTNAITSFASLALGGTTAPNYTLAGASGAVVVTNPQTSFSIAPSLDNTGTNLVLIWDSIPGVSYQVRGSPDLNTWTNVGGPINATATQTTNLVPINSIPAQAFFDIFAN